jgi:hypothetical protein
MGRAAAAALAGRGTPPLAILGIPASSSGHAPGDFREADMLFDFGGWPSTGGTATAPDSRRSRRDS